MYEYIEVGFIVRNDSDDDRVTLTKRLIAVLDRLMPADESYSNPKRFGGDGKPVYIEGWNVTGWDGPDPALLPHSGPKVVAHWVLRSEGETWRYDVITPEHVWEAIHANAAMEILRDNYDFPFRKAMAALNLAQAQWRFNHEDVSIPAGSTMDWDPKFVKPETERAMENQGWANDETIHANIIVDLIEHPTENTNIKIEQVGEADFFVVLPDGYRFPIEKHDLDLVLQARAKVKVDMIDAYIKAQAR